MGNLITGKIKRVESQGGGFYLNYVENPHRQRYRPSAKVIVIRSSNGAIPAPRTRFDDSTLMSREEAALGAILSNSDPTKRIVDTLTDEGCARIMEFIDFVAAGGDPAQYNPALQIVQRDPIAPKEFIKVNVEDEAYKALDQAAYGHEVEVDTGTPEFGSHKGKRAGKSQKSTYVRKAERDAKREELEEARGAGLF